MLPVSEEKAPVRAPLLEVRNLTVRFPLRAPVFARGRHQITAVDGVSFSIHRGEVFALVGESGSGKTSLARAIVWVRRPDGGSVLFNGVDLATLNGKQLRMSRRGFQMVFQDPYSSLDPHQTIGRILSEPLRVHRVSNVRSRVYELLTLVGLEPAFAARFPHEFSGGQLQRVGIARALALKPALLVCDEPVSALDVSIRAQVINLLIRLQRELGLSYLLIAHDLGIVRQIADVTAVMYLGKIVEIGTNDNVFNHSGHPYTVALMSAVPVPNVTVERNRKRIILVGEIPSPGVTITGCRFHTRCWLRTRLGDPEICTSVEPPLEGRVDHSIACHFTGEVMR